MKNTTEAINNTSSKLNDLNTLEMTDRLQLQLDSIERDRLLTTFTEIITSKKQIVMLLQNRSLVRQPHPHLLEAKTTSIWRMEAVHRAIVLVEK